MQYVFLFSMAYSAVGFLLSLGIHVLSVAGIQPGGDGLMFSLHGGIFPLGFFLVALIGKMSDGVVMRKDLWKVVLRGCPPWMKYTTYCVFIYALINFLIVFVIAPHGQSPVGGRPPVIAWRMFSGHWMVFYFAGLAISMSFYRIGWKQVIRKCPNGHAVAPNHMFCPICGSKLDV